VWKIQLRYYFSCKKCRTQNSFTISVKDTEQFFSRTDNRPFSEICCNINRYILQCINIFDNKYHSYNTILKRNNDEQTLTDRHRETSHNRQVSQRRYINLIKMSAPKEESPSQLNNCHASNIYFWTTPINACIKWSFIRYTPLRVK